MVHVPSVGRIVRFKLDADTASRINKRRMDATKSGIARENSGTQVHVGNAAEAEHVYPMLIVCMWGETEESAVNGQVFLDGNDTYWATSVWQDIAATSDNNLQPNHWRFPAAV